MLSEGDFSGLPVIPLDWPPHHTQKIKKMDPEGPFLPRAAHCRVSSFWRKLSEAGATFSDFWTLNALFLRIPVRPDSSRLHHPPPSLANCGTAETRKIFRAVYGVLQG